MKDDKASTEAGHQYAAAHEAHYATKDLREAMGLYLGIMSAHPGTQEAGYSRSQILNIAKSVVPEQEILDVQVTLVLAHLDREGLPESEPALAGDLLASQLSGDGKAAESPGEATR